MTGQGLPLNHATRGADLCADVASRVDPEVRRLLFDAAYLGGPSSIEVLVRRLASLDYKVVSEAKDPLFFVLSVAEAVERARYWQEPDPLQRLLMIEPVMDALSVVAEAIDQSVSALRWCDPVDPLALRYTIKYSGGETADDLFPPPVREPPSASPIMETGWWSRPPTSSFIAASRPIDSIGSGELVWLEDDNDAELARIWPMRCPKGTRTFEISGISDWVKLVESYGHRVDSATEDVWNRHTRSHRRWVAPDWVKFAEDYDAAHLSVRGYLVTADMKIDLNTSYSTLLAGWSPDQSYWNVGVLAPSDSPQTWQQSPPLGVVSTAWAQTD
jgi:hypothetical protein